MTLQATVTVAKKSNSNLMGILHFSSFKKSDVDTKQFEKGVNNLLKEFDYTGYFSQIKKHFEVFAEESIWTSLEIDYFRDTGITTTTKEISCLLSPDLVESIINKTSISCDITTEEELIHLE